MKTRNEREAEFKAKIAELDNHIEEMMELNKFSLKL